MDIRNTYFSPGKQFLIFKIRLKLLRREKPPGENLFPIGNLGKEKKLPVIQYS